MHAIRTTPGFITSSRPSGEAGKLISVFTRDLGLVFASAQGIRFEKSKLRPFTQDHSFGLFSFVRGKEFWRLTSAQEGTDMRTDVNIANAADRPRRVDESRTLLARIASLLDRLLHGEEAHPELFDCIEMSSRFLADSPELNAEEMETLESLVVIRMLRHLGYIGHSGDLDGYVDSARVSRQLLKELGAKRGLMNRHINKALRESHL